MYPALLEYLEVENGPYEPMCSIASSDPLHGWEDTIDDAKALTLLRKLISKRGLQFALRFARVFSWSAAIGSMWCWSVLSLPMMGRAPNG